MTSSTTPRGTWARYRGSSVRLPRLGVGLIGALGLLALALASMGPVSAHTTSLRATSSATAGSAYTALTPSRLLDTRSSNQTLGPNSSLNLTVTGGSVPATATAVALNVTVTNTTDSSYLAVYPAGGTRPLVSNLNWVMGETVPNLVIVPVGANGQVTIYNHTGNTDVVVDLQGYFAPEASGSVAGQYSPLTPARITDTRTGSGYPNAGSTLGAGSTLNIQVTGQGGVPVNNVSAALLNVTVTNTTDSGYLEVYPQGATQPTASNLNWTAGETVANRVVVPVSANGQITVYNHTGSADVVVDVNGYFTTAGAAPANASLYSPMTPVRVLDTRTTGGTLGANTSTTVQMQGVDGIAANASAVVTNVTATNTTAASFFTVYPGGTRPTASDVNWSAGQTVPNLTVATLSSSGSTTVYNHAGSADLVIDAFGYFTPTAPLTLSPATQSVGVGNTATVTATALNPGGTPATGDTVSFNLVNSAGTTITAGNLTCVVGTTGQCTVTMPAQTAAGAYTVNAVLDTDFDSDTPSGTDGDTDSEPSATATINWTSGTAAGITVEPGGTQYSNPVTGDQPAYSAPSSPVYGFGRSVSQHLNSPFTAYAAVTDNKGNPVAGQPVIFTIYHATPQTFEGTSDTCDPEFGTLNGCTVSTMTATTNSSGIASVTWTQSAEGTDYYYAALSTATNIGSELGEVVWGNWSLSLSPTYTAAGGSLQVGQTETYTGTSVNATGGANTNCVAVEFYQNKWHAGPKANVYTNGTSAFFSGVAAGEAAYSSSNCTSAIDFATTSPTTIFMKPNSSGQFTFSIKSNSPGDSASPVAATATSDFAATECDGFYYCGQTAIGATTTWASVPASAYAVSVTPTTNASQATGTTRTYTDTTTVNGSANTSSIANAFSFQQLVNGSTTPAMIADTTVTVGSTTYCVEGSDTTGADCPTGSTIVAAASANPIGSTGVSVVYYSYPGAATADTEVEVTGAGTFSPIVASTGVGSATPVGWVDMNGDQTLDSGDPSANGGSVTWGSPVVSGVSLSVAHNAATPGAAKPFSNGTYYGPVAASDTQASQVDGTSSETVVTAGIVDQSGNPITSGTTVYAVNWTIKNNGATTSTVYVSGANNIGLHCGTGSTASVGGVAVCGDTNLYTVSHFVNPDTLASNNTDPGTGPLSIAGGATMTLTTYATATSPSYLVVNSAEVTTATVTAQLAQDSAATPVAGAAIGAAQSVTVGWALTPTAGATLTGTSIVAYENSNYPEPSSETAGTGTYDYAVINTAVGTFLVQFDQTAGQTYTISGNTLQTEAQFESALGSATTYVVSNYGNTTSPYQNNSIN